MNNLNKSFQNFIINFIVMENLKFKELAVEFKKEYYEDYDSSYCGYRGFWTFIARMDKNNRFVRKVVDLLEDGKIEELKKMKEKIEKKEYSYNNWRAQEDQTIFTNRLKGVLEALN